MSEDTLNLEMALKDLIANVDEWVEADLICLSDEDMKPYRDALANASRCEIPVVAAKNAIEEALSPFIQGVGFSMAVGAVLQGIRQYLNYPEREIVSRCPICDWPLAESADKGCVPGNCSYRPEHGSPEWKRIQKRKTEIEVQEGKSGQE